MFKKLVMITVLACFSFVSLPVFAGDDTAQPVAGVSQDDAKKLKEAAQQLGTAFGIKPKEEPVKNQPQTQATQKNMADVADKGLEMVKGFVLLSPKL